MKRICILTLITLLCLSFFACNTASTGTNESTQGGSSANNIGDFSDTAQMSGIENYASAVSVYSTFEETCKAANIVVQATFIQSEAFGEQYTRHEFIVKDKLLGETEEKINVFTSRLNISVVNNGDVEDNVPSYNQSNISFIAGVDYLLVLNKDRDLYTFVPVYTLINDVIIRLDDLSLSKMYNMPLGDHAKGLNITKDTSKDDMISYVKELTKDNSPAYQYIDSDKFDEIINLSDNIIKIRIDGNYKAVKNEFRSHELYDCTVIEVLKGNMKVGTEYRITFFPDTVKSGEEWIAAVVPLDETSSYLDLTSRNSLYPCNMKQDIIQALSKTGN